MLQSESHSRLWNDTRTFDESTKVSHHECPRNLVSRTASCYICFPVAPYSQSAQFGPQDFFLRSIRGIHQHPTSSTHRATSLGNFWKIASLATNESRNHDKIAVDRRCLEATKRLQVFRRQEKTTNPRSAPTQTQPLERAVAAFAVKLFVPSTCR